MTIDEFGNEIGEPFMFDGVQVKPVMARFRSIAYGRRPATQYKSQRFIAQRPNGTWECMCASPKEAVAIMREFWAAKNKAIAGHAQAR